MNATSVLINEVILIWRPRAFSYKLFAPIWMLFTSKTEIIMSSVTVCRPGLVTYICASVLRSQLQVVVPYIYIYMFWYFKSLSVQQIDYMIFYVSSNDISIIFVVIVEMF